MPKIECLYAVHRYNLPYKERFLFEWKIFIFQYIIYNNCRFETKWLRHEKSRSKPMQWLSCENRHELECLNPSIFYAVRVNKWLQFDAYPLSKRLSDRCQVSRLLKWCSLHCTTWLSHDLWVFQFLTKF